MTPGSKLGVVGLGAALLLVAVAAATSTGPDVEPQPEPKPEPPGPKPGGGPASLFWSVWVSRGEGGAAQWWAGPLPVDAEHVHERKTLLPVTRAAALAGAVGSNTIGLHAIGTAQTGEVEGFDRELRAAKGSAPFEYRAWMQVWDDGSKSYIWADVTDTFRT